MRSNRTYLTIGSIGWLVLAAANLAMMLYRLSRADHFASLTAGGEAEFRRFTIEQGIAGILIPVAVACIHILRIKFLNRTERTASLRDAK